MRIAIISDAWRPQINGVVRTLTETIKNLQEFGHDVTLISPLDFRTIPCPTYAEIRLAIFPYRTLSKRLHALEPHAIHVATEGPLGMATRRWCLKNNTPFTTAYHTQFPEYIYARTRIPLGITYAWIRRFHRPSKNVMTPTPTIRKQLQSRGFDNTALWARGVNLARFYPGERTALDDLCREDERDKPKFICIGRVAVEKNIEAFLSLDLPGSKWVVGDGPARKSLEKKYPDVHFLGAYPQEELPPFYRAADVFVFPSLTDTFGLVLLEAMACGTPVAAFPVVGPIDVVSDKKAGVLDDDLGKACVEALKLNRDDARAFATSQSWENATKQFEALLHPFE